MKPRRANGHDRRQHVLAAATDLFARKGFQGTKTRQIAEKARINEALLFRDFPCKEDLYWAVLDEKCRCRQSQSIIRQQLESEEDEFTVLAGVARGMLERNSQDPSITRLWLFSGLESHRLASRFYRTYLADFYEVMADFIRKKIKQGRFARVSPQIAARAFFGMLAHHLLVHELLGGKQVEEFDLKEVSETAARIWLNGMLSTNGTVSSRGSSKRQGP